MRQKMVGYIKLSYPMALVPQSRSFIEPPILPLFIYSCHSHNKQHTEMFVLHIWHKAAASNKLL